MKKFKFFMFLCTILFTGFINAQDLSQNPKLKSEIEDIADYVGGKLMNCCSTWGGRNFSTTVYWGKDDDGKYQTRISQLTKRLTITMHVDWYGSITGAHYWIKGKTIVDLESGKKEWMKIADSGGFSPGCGRSCNVN